jgi:hypothetical protein
MESNLPQQIPRSAVKAQFSKIAMRIAIQEKSQNDFLISKLNSKTLTVPTDKPAHELSPRLIISEYCHENRPSGYLWLRIDRVLELDLRKIIFFQGFEYQT